MENISTNLYNRAKSKNRTTNFSKPIFTHKFSQVSKQPENEKLPIISSRYLTENKPKIINKNKLNPLKGRVKNYSSYLKENNLQVVSLFLDPISLRNFMLTCSKFYRIICENDEVWFLIFKRKFKTKHNYETNRGKWRTVFFNTMQQNQKINFENLKAKFLKKANKNAYQVNKDVYYISNNLYNFLKPIFSLELDGRLFKVKHIFTNKILSHINLFANFDQEYIDMKKLKCLKVNITETNLGIYKNLINYDIQKKKFISEITTKICKIYYDRELTISTFNTNLIFFLNISIPICKICETIFDFMKGIHDKNLNYFDDVDTKFGLYDYSLLVNLKSWKNLYFSVNVNTVDFKEENGLLCYYNDSICNIVIKIAVCSNEPVFEIKTIALSDKISHFLIMDLMLLTYKGDHVLCESCPINIKVIWFNFLG
jgi:hypothetical protein